MRLAVTILDRARDRSTELLVGAADAVATGDVLDRVRQAAGLPPDQALHLDEAVLDPALPWADSGLHDGVVLGTAPRRLPAYDVGGRAEGRVEVRVVGGPGAGRVHRLLPGEATLGADPACALPLEAAADVSAHVIVGVDGSVGVRPHAEVLLDRDPLPPQEVTAWPAGAVLAVGPVRLAWGPVTVADTVLVRGEEPGRLDHNRPPRLRPGGAPPRLTLPRRPREHADRGMPWLVMAMPLLMALTLAVVMDEPRYLLMGVFSPLMMVGGHLQQRRGGRLSLRQQQAAYDAAVADLRADADAAVAAEVARRRAEAPDPAEVLLIATAPRARLWERRPEDPDHLLVRLGLGDLPSGVVLGDPDEPEHRRERERAARDVPVTVPLAACGVLGLAGPDDLARSVAAWAVAQLCVLQSPRDVRVQVLSDPAAATAWSWVARTPHALGESPGPPETLTARRLADLVALLAAREAEDSDRGAPGAPRRADVVVVLDGARRLRSLPGVAALLARGPAVGITAVCLDRARHLLPEEAGAVADLSDTTLVLHREGAEAVEDVLVDRVPAAWPARVGRAVAPVRDVSDADDASALPRTCRLLDVVGLDPDDPEALLTRWSATPRTGRVPLGASSDGPLVLDLDRDGPHALIAGTTGSGKSELLRALVAALAVGNRPDELSFVLVDYKGGAAFRECADLPHTVGTVTDLDPHLVRRALTSLRAELRRRERRLADAGVADLAAYAALRASREGLTALPRLVIVVDEFAALARELPDFVTGLVDVAQRGRSLGLHLVLATQRPSGVVSPEIRANTTLRIALRTTDAAESHDVIGTGEAAHIPPTLPGRAQVRLGAGPTVPLQVAALQGARRPLDESPWAVLLDERCAAPPRSTAGPTAGPTVGDDAGDSDLTRLVAAVGAATERLGCPPAASPWLPPLPERLTLADLPAAAGIPWALEDRPAEQTRAVVTLDPDRLTHLAVLGSRSGRSQTLRTIAGSAAATHSPERLHLHALDGGAGAMAVLAALPHCGVVAGRAEPDRVDRLLERLVAEVERRRGLLQEHGCADLAELHGHLPEAERPARTLLLVDSWEGLVTGAAGPGAEREDRLVDRLRTLLREGAAVGLHVVATGDRTLLGLRTASLFEQRIALRLGDPADLVGLGVPARSLPETLPDGRAVRLDGAGGCTELQVALLDPDPSAAAQADAIRGLADRHPDPAPGRGPLRLDPLPSRIPLASLRSAAPVGDPIHWALLGLGGDRLAPVGLSLQRLPSAVIAGPPGSGRSTALAVAADSLLRGGARLVVLAPRASVLRDLSGRDGVLAVLTDPHVTSDRLAPLLARGPVCVVVDDGELLHDAPAGPTLRDLARAGAGAGHTLLLGGDSARLARGFTGWQTEAAGRQGLLLAPREAAEGDLVGVRLSRGALDLATAPGRGLLHAGDGRAVPVQVADPAHP